MVNMIFKLVHFGTGHFNKISPMASVIVISGSLGTCRSWLVLLLGDNSPVPVILSFVQESVRDSWSVSIMYKESQRLDCLSINGHLSWTTPSGLSQTIP